MADLSKLSDADLLALQSGDLSKVSDAGLTHLSAPEGKPQAPAAAPQESGNGFKNLILGAVKGTADLVHAPVQTVLNAADKLNQIVPGYNPEGAGSAYLHKKNNQFNNYLKTQEQDYQAATPGSWAAGAGRVGAGTLPFLFSGGTSAAPAAVGAIPKSLALAKTLGAGGGLSMLTQPVTDVQTDASGDNSFFKEKAIQGALGVAGTGAGKVVGKALGRMIKPNVAADVQMLVDSGVKPTIGQLMGGGWAATENKLSSVPILGDMIKNAQRGTVEDFNKAVYNRALNPLGETAEKLTPGHDGVQAIKTALKTAYDTVLPKLNFKADQQFSAELGNLSWMLNNGNVPPQVASQFNNIVKNEVTSRMTKGGTMDGIQFKELENKLGPMIKGFASSTDQNQRTLGGALGEVMTSLRSGLERSNPEQAPVLKAVNEGYANYARIRAAAASQGAKDGVFTPAQLSAAVKSLDKSAGKGNFATGQALLQDLSNAGKNVMPTYPDSGTAGRNALLMLPGLGAAATVAPLSTGASIGAGALSTLPYTDAGKKLAVALLAKRPAGAAQLSNATKQATPAIGAALMPTLSPELMKLLGQ